MKIIELHVENFKRLKAVTIRPGENNVVEISGRNAQGKSSAIDAIWAALQGSSALRNTPAPVRKGAEKAEIRLDLGKYVVTRNWTATGNTYLTVTTGGEYKAKLNSPQKLLDNIVGDLCFDPLSFTRLGDKEQADMVMSLLKLELADLDRGREDAYEERKAVNRDISRAKAELDGLPKPEEGLPAEPVDLNALLREHEDALKETQRLNGVIAKAETLRKQLAEAEEQLRRAQERTDRLKVELDAAETETEKVVYPDVEAIKWRVDAAGETNRKIESARKRGDLESRIAAFANQAEDLTQTIDATYKAKQDRIAAAQMPVVGLSFDLETGRLTLNGVPLKQASRSEQLRVAVVMAMAQHPELRVMRIEDASILDAESMAMLKGLAADNDYQIWMEVVDESGEVGIYIEDGEVWSSNLPDAPDSGLLPTPPVAPPVTEEELL
ncbi:MAG: AAA family ATPase [Candidatus Hydrogenedentes bacterium]|nr:AAA family ATPase [Candidatus Hydrogenedentota bacterium]